MLFNPFNLGGVSGSETWTPTCLGAGLIGWYDGTDSANMSLSGSDVTQLNDLSGLNNHMTVIASNSPEFSTDHINFDHTTVESLEALPALSTDYGAYFLVANISGSTTDPSTLVGFNYSTDDTSVANEIQPFRYSGARVRMWENGASLINLGALLTGTKRLFSAVANSTNIYGRVNGATSATAVTGTKRFNFAQVTLGRSYQDALASSMEFYELIVVKGDITTDQFESLEWYLANKHGLTLDASHTYFSTAPTSCDPITTVPPTYDMTQVWDIYFSAHTDYQSGFQTTTGSDGNTYYLSGRDVANTTDILPHPDNTDPAISHGMYLSGKGLVNSENEAASMRMYVTTDVGNKAHNNGPFTMFVVYTWDGNTNDINYKHWIGGKKGFKIEGASSGVNVSDGFNTSADGTGTASGGETFDFDPAGSYSINTGNPFFICVQRDVANKKYKIYTGEIDTGHTAASDLKVQDTVSDSGWYLVNPYSNSNDFMEFLTDEDSTLHAWGYSPSVVPVADINATFEHLVTRF